MTRLTPPSGQINIDGTACLPVQMAAPYRSPLMMVYSRGIFSLYTLYWLARSKPIGNHSCNPCLRCHWGTFSVFTRRRELRIEICRAGASFNTFTAFFGVCGEARIFWAPNQTNRDYCCYRNVHVIIVNVIVHSEGAN